MDLLIDTNIVLDVCANRMPFAPTSAAALQRCQDQGAKLWLYTGSVQTMEYSMVREVQRKAESQSTQISQRQCVSRARQALKMFVQDKHWLASLAGEGDVFDSPDPGYEQLILALSRFAPGSIKVLTRDELLCERYPAQTISPQQYLQIPQQSKAIDFIDLKTQQDRIRTALENNIHRVLHHGQYIMGPEVKELEEKLAAYVGTKHCITASSGTDTLLIAMMALGIKPGDEIITTPFTFIATGEMIALLGAIPVFVDIDPRTYNIDPNKIEAAITPKTKAIMPVSLYGQCADFDNINAIAAKHGIPVIEDGAQSFGATYKGRKSCGLSTIGSASFFPSKPLGCYGDGGALFTNDDVLAKNMREIRLHGQDRRYHHPIIGINGRMDTLQAAILLAKLEIFDEEVKARAEIGARYSKLINSALNPQSSSLGVTTPYIAPHNTSVYAQYTVLVENREAVQKKFSDAGIPTAVHYPITLNLQPVFSHLNQPAGSFPIAEEMAKRVMSLPMGPDLSYADQDRVVNVLQEKS
jgi:UDP-2-acetamido-2-deoxy-ribo-hexuluronate aminotransferase